LLRGEKQIPSPRQALSFALMCALFTGIKKKKRWAKKKKKKKKKKTKKQKIL